MMKHVLSHVFWTLEASKREGQKPGHKKSMSPAGLVLIPSPVPVVSLSPVRFC